MEFFKKLLEKKIARIFSNEFLKNLWRYLPLECLRKSSEKNVGISERIPEGFLKKSPKELLYNFQGELLNEILEEYLK